MSTDKSRTVKTLRFKREKGQKPWSYVVIETGEPVEVLMTYTERMERETAGFITLPDGREARFSLGTQVLRDGGKTQKEAQRARTRAKWPLRTSIAGVGEDRVGDLRSFLKERGVRGTYVHEDGSLEWASPRARYDYCRAVGLYDRNAGYSDPAPLNC